MNKKHRILVGVIILLLGVMLVSAATIQILPLAKETAASNILDKIRIGGGFEQELKPGEFVSVVDSKTGKVIDKMSRVVYTGDEIIGENNVHYRITKVKGDKAFAKNLGIAKGVVWKDEWDIQVANAQVKAAQANGKSQIALYHTHSDESYVPTDGTESKPASGGIFQVGTALAQKLRNQGVTVVDDKTPHEPHDANAYHRSRRTALKLLRDRPVALLDVHRDGVPDPDFYNKQIDGQPATKIRLVVGRQNPHMANNLEFAKTVKAYMDKHKPGFIREIFIGKGMYNQDLGPRALLLEVGTHTNTKQRAENGAQVFAEMLPPILNLNKAAAQPGPNEGETSDINPGEESTGWKTLGWIVGIVLLGGATFLFISTGSMKGMKSKLGELRKTEFANFFGLKKVKDTDKNNKKE